MVFLGTLYDKQQTYETEITPLSPNKRGSGDDKWIQRRHLYRKGVGIVAGHREDQSPLTTHSENEHDGHATRGHSASIALAYQVGGRLAPTSKVQM